MARLSLALLAAALMTSPAAADPAPDPQPAEYEGPVQFVDMGVILIEGAYVRPKSVFIDAKQKLIFDRLIELKRPVLPKLRQTARDATLR